MKALKVEYVESGFLLNESDKAKYQPVRQKGMIPVVRLAEVDAVMAKAVKIMETCCAVGEIRFKTCVLSQQVSDQIQAFLASPLVAAWRKRQEEKT